MHAQVSDEFCELDLSVLFAARSVAIVGASADATKHTNRPIRALERYGFAGDVYLVNPHYTSIGDRPCYPSLGAVPGGIDVVFICRPAAEVPALIAECNSLEIPFAIVYSSGFGESGKSGLALQAALVGGRTRIVGPNSLGVASVSNNQALTISSAALEPVPVLPPGRTALISQSGGLMSMAQELLADRSIGIGWAISTGNEADLSVTDFLRFAAIDDSIDTVLLIIEGTKLKGALPQALATLQAAGKRVFALKLGASEAGNRGVMTHTGRLTSSPAVYQGMFAQYGVTQVADPVSLVEAAATTTQSLSSRANLNSVVRPKPRVAVVSNSGGGAALLADCANGAGLAVPRFSTSTVELFADAMPTLHGADNPVDLSSTAYPLKELQRAFSIILSDENIDGGIFGLSMTAAKNPIVREALVAAVADVGKPVAAVVLAGVSGDDVMSLLRQQGVPAFRSPTSAAMALAGALGHFVRSSSSKATTEPLPTAPKNPLPDRTLDEWESGLLLAEFDIVVASSRQAQTAESAAAASLELGFPVAVKVLSPDIAHKVDAGGVVLGVSDDVEAASAFTQVTTAAAASQPAAHISGVLVQKQVPPGLEVILGFRHDPDLGPTIVVGFGGSMVEILDQVATAIAPLRENDSDDLLERSGVLRVLRAKHLHREAEKLGQIIRNFSRLIAAYGSDIAEIDLNPVILGGGQATIVDAVIVPSAAATVSDHRSPELACVPQPGT